ncbi:MAG: hypothetical protein ACE5GS_00105 [Kiloniellaceae bacterium]
MNELSNRERWGLGVGLVVIAVLAEDNLKKAKREASAAGSADPDNEPAVVAARERVRRAEAKLAEAGSAAREARVARDTARGAAEAKKAAEAAGRGARSPS